MEKMVNQGCGERRALRGQQGHEESQDSKGKPAMLAFLGRRVKLDRQAHRDSLDDRDTTGILVFQDLRDDLGLLATLAPPAPLDLQDLQAHQEWV